MTTDKPEPSYEGLSSLIYKRHAGDGWFMFDELPDRPGYYSKRFADHCALGLWGSTHYEFHLYETKISREDVKREMRDPSKVDGVGKYAHKWWLVISDPKIIEDVLIPDVWGILAPVTRGGSRMLKEIRKAKARKPKPFDPMFCVSMMRTMAKSWVRPERHRELEEKLYRLQHPTVSDDEAAERQEEHDYKLKYTRLAAAVAAFEAASGVSMEDLTAGSGWRAPHLGKAVKIAMEIHGPTGPARLRDDIHTLLEAASTLDHAHKSAAQLAAQLRTLLPADVEHSPRCRGRFAGITPEQVSLNCSCGAVVSEVERKLGLDARARDCQEEVPPPVVANGNDDSGGGEHRGHVGQDVQDAGALLRD